MTQFPDVRVREAKKKTSGSINHNPYETKCIIKCM